MPTPLSGIGIHACMSCYHRTLPSPCPSWCLDTKRYVSYIEGVIPHRVIFLTTFTALAFISALAQETLRPKDVRTLAIPILRHRIIVNYGAVGDGITSETLIQKLLKEVRG